MVFPDFGCSGYDALRIKHHRAITNSSASCRDWGTERKRSYKNLYPFVPSVSFNPSDRLNRTIRVTIKLLQGKQGIKGDGDAFLAGTGIVDPVIGDLGGIRFGDLEDTGTGFHQFPGLGSGSAGDLISAGDGVASGFSQEFLFQFGQLGKEIGQV